MSTRVLYPPHLAVACSMFLLQGGAHHGEFCPTGSSRDIPCLSYKLSAGVRSLIVIPLCRRAAEGAAAVRGSRIAAAALPRPSGGRMSLRGSKPLARHRDPWLQRCSSQLSPCLASAMLSASLRCTPHMQGDREETVRRLLGLLLLSA